MPGPAPKPAERKRLLGNPGRRPLPEPIIIMPDQSLAVPDPPEGLSEAGTDRWCRLWGVGGAWLSERTDWDIMVRLCQAHDERDRLRKEVARVGWYSAGSMGQLVTHPAVDQLRAVELLITRWESLCGFTPSDRSRLGVAEVVRMSKLEELIAKRSESRRAQ